MEIFAHRGNSGEAPENTLSAFEQAISLGADGVELDVQASSDGVPVVIHDEELGRTAGGRGWVGEHSLGELKKLDAGSWFNGSFAGEGIPTLAEVLDLLLPSPLLINIELKTFRFPYQGLAGKVLGLIRERGLGERVILSSFNHLTLAEARVTAPHIRMAALLRSHLIQCWDYAQRHGFQALHLSQHTISETLLAECRARKVTVRAFTVDDPEEAGKLRDWGVDGIFTNHPRRIIEK